MEWVLKSAQSFSSVEESVDEQFFSQCVREYALTLVSMLAEHYGPARVSDMESLSSMLEHPLAADYNPFWCPELGHCLIALKTDKLSFAQRGITQIALNLFSAGVPGRWTRDFVEPIRLRLGQFLLPKATRLEVESDGDEAHINIQGTDSRHRLRFSATRNHRVEWQGAGVEAAPYLETVHNRVLLLSGPHGKELDLPNPALPGVDAVTETHQRHLSASLDLVKQHFPSWSSWFDRVLRVITIAQRPPEGIHSGTVEGYYGFISMSDSDNPLKVAESLIHESSHQYFFLLNRFAALTNDDGRRFYSPFVNTERPPDKLLLAYHAFTNVELFYRGCLRVGIEAAQCERVLAQLKRELGCVQEALATEIDLTPVGQCMFDALLKRRSGHEILN